METIDLSKANFGKPYLTRKGDPVIFIKKDEDLKSKYLIAHPYWGALLYNQDGSCTSKGIDEDDIVKVDLRAYSTRTKSLKK